MKNIDVLKALGGRVNATVRQLAVELSAQEEDVQQHIEWLVGLRLIESYTAKGEPVFYLSRHGKNIVDGIYGKLQKAEKQNG